MAVPVSDLDFQKSHTKFIIGNENAISITTSGNDTNIILDAVVFVFDERGGFRSIEPTSITLGNNDILCLSGTSGTYSDPQLYNKGAGTKLYLYKFQFNNPLQTEALAGYAELGAVLNFVWTPTVPAFNKNFAKAHTKFIIGNPRKISIVNFTTSVTITIDTGTYLIDERGGYRTIQSTSITLGNNDILCLSAEDGNYKDPEIYIKGIGQKLYLYKFQFNNPSQKAPLPGYAELGAVLNNVWTPFNPSFVEGVYDRFDDFEKKGLLMRRTEENSPVEDKIQNFVKKWRNRRQDVNIVMLDGSISTDMNYSVKRADQAYRPPCCTEKNIPSFIEEKLRWKDQHYRRYDSVVDPKTVGSPATFTETATVEETKIADSVWDWISNGPAQSYNWLTRILTGGNPSVSYSFQATYRRCDFIYRTDSLSSAALTVTISGGGGQVQVYDEVSETWKEANNFVFSAQESGTPEVVEISETVYGQIMKTVYQKRLKMRRAAFATPALTVTIASSDGGRLCYWGIQYSKNDFMINLINSARGSHNIKYLSFFEEWSVDYWKPDLIIYPCNTINEGANASAATSGDSPVAFSGRFNTFVTALLGKSYKPDMIAYIQFCMRNQGLVNASDSVNATYINGYGSATVFDYYDTLFQVLREQPIAAINAFYEYWTIAKKRSEYYGTTMYAEMHGQVGQTSNSFTCDTTHLNEYGAMIGWRFLERYFNF